jgi:predicted PurR-regulated permease PerM/methylmalonyl-CoA mutase cobalamin-binding subunit
VAVLLTVGMALSIFAGLSYVVGNQFLNLMHDLPQYKENLKDKIRPLRGSMQDSLAQTQRTLRELGEELKKPDAAPPQRIPKVEVVPPPPGIAEMVHDALGPVLKPVATGVVVIVFLLFMLLERDSLRERLIRLMGADLHVTTQALADASQRVSRYLSMQTLINSVQGTLLAIGLYFIGVPNAVLWGALLIVLRFIPYIGPWVAALFPIALSFAVFEDWTHPMLTIGLIVLLEILSNQLMEPLLYGHSTGVSPLALLVAAVFWTWLWGGAGLALAIPLTVTLVVMGKHVPQLSLFSMLLGNDPVLAPAERFYQRLLARVPEEADEVVEEALKEQSLREILEEIAMPALAMAERDYHRGALSDTQHLYIVAHIDGLLEDLLQEAESDASTAASEARAPRVVCVPAHERGDETAASVFARVLTLAGLPARSLPVVPSRDELVRLALQHPASCLCVCSFAPMGLARARQLCRALHERAPAVPLVAALWGLAEVPDRVQVRFRDAGAVEIFSRIGEGVPAIARVTRPSAAPADAKETAPAV